MVNIIEEKINRDDETGLVQIEKMIRDKGGILLRVSQNSKQWKVVYKIKAKIKV